MKLRGDQSQKIHISVKGGIWTRVTGKPRKNTKRPLPSPGNQAKKK